MKRTNFLGMLLLMLTMLLPLAATAAPADGLYRIKNSTTLSYLYEEDNRTLHSSSSYSATDLHGLWIVTASGTGYEIRNAYTGNYLPSSGEAATVLSTQLNASTTYLSAGDGGAYRISWASDFTGNSVLRDSVGALYSGALSTNNNSFLFEASTAVTDAEVRTHLESIYAPVLTHGKYYRIRNVAYKNLFLTQVTGETGLKGRALSTIDPHLQIWQAQASGSNWVFKNALTQKYIQSSNGVRSSSFTLTDTPAAFTVKSRTEDAWVPTFSLHGSNYVVHCDGQQNIVTWYDNGRPSFWTFEEVAVNETELAQLRTSGYQYLYDNRGFLFLKLQKYFSDPACTELNSSYKAGTKADLLAAMRADGLPEALVLTAGRVYDDTWNTANVEANKYEKDFRIHEYGAYSDPDKWPDIVHKNFTFSNLSNPTGIILSAGEIGYIFVNSPIPTGCQLKADLVIGYNHSTNESFTLQQGLNVIRASAESQIYIYYNISDTSKKLADIPAMKIHIEGGRANGYFDAARHTTTDWTRLRALSDQGFFTDNALILKSATTLFLAERSVIFALDDAGEWTVNGHFYGPNGVMKKWDDINYFERQMIKADQFYDRFNCMLVAKQTPGALYATSRGTFYDKIPFSYKALSIGGDSDEGGNIWAVAHEVGHHYQRPFNIVGATEASNNLFSNIAVWKRGDNVSRNASMPDILTWMNNGGSWYQATLRIRYQMFWQLWLYYEYLGHHPNFYAEVSDRLRKDPLDKRYAHSDLWKFAKVCSDVAQEDLTEFFTQWGFFREFGENVWVSHGDAFYDGYYARVYINADRTQLQGVLDHMAQYSTKRTNLFFLDERIKTLPAEGEFSAPGATRYATSSFATPGDALEVGDVGMVTDYAGAASTAEPSTVKIDSRTVKVTGTGSVGYKVYDDAGNLIFVSNRNTFVLPASIDMSKITIKVASSNGTEVTVAQNGQVLTQYDKPSVSTFENTFDLVLSTSRTAPEHSYYIQNASNSYYADSNTRGTNNLAARGRFAFFAGDAAGQYYVYSVDSAKYLTYTSLSSGKNRVQYVDELGDARAWTFAYENSTKSTVDILPALDTNTAATRVSWNWYGGVGSEYKTVGFYAANDGVSSWKLIGTTPYIQLHNLLPQANETLALTGIGYPTSSSAARTALQQAITDANAALTSGTVTDADVLNLQNAINTYRTSSVDLQLPEDGKVYRISSDVSTRRYITNNLVGINLGLTTDTTTTATLWVCQYVNGSPTFASLEGTGYISHVNYKGTSEYRTEYCRFNMPRGTTFGSLALVSIDYGTATLVDNNGGKVDGNGNSSPTWRNGTNLSTTAGWLFEEVANATFSLKVASGTNGNYATLYLPYAVALPTGVTANTFDLTPAAGASDAYATPRALVTSVLPALTPVLISADRAGTIALTPSPYQAPVANSKLVGTLRRIGNNSLESGKNYYALIRSTATGKIVFRQVSTADIPANRAYHVTTTTMGSSMEFAIDWNSLTGISSAPQTDEATELPIFDLSGRRVQHLKKGSVYLRGGKRFVAQ